jgi:uncharacterized 2Fe-2S/4Fe-4S cluster protein (DUF4445 family)
LRRLASAADPEEGTVLRETVQKALRRLVAHALRRGGIDPGGVKAAAVAGNAAMALLFLGFDTQSLATAPFTSGLEGLGTVQLAPETLGLRSPTTGFLLPGIGSFVGGDITAGLLACALDRGERPALFLDAGTNGEIVLAPSRGPWFAASTAAGPAFEGGHLTDGGPGGPGAVCGVRVDTSGEVHLDVIGDEPPRWLCGTGILALTAGLLEVGALREDGRLNGEFRGVGEVEKHRFLSLPAGGHRNLRFTQADVREVQLAKGAIQAGWRILLDRAGLSPSSLKRIVVTGAFGNMLDARAARRIGLLPDIPVVPSALPSGAVRGLLRAASGLDSRTRWERLAFETEYVPLGDTAFQEVFIDSLALRPFPGG